MKGLYHLSNGKIMFCPKFLYGFINEFTEKEEYYSLKTQRSSEFVDPIS